MTRMAVIVAMVSALCFGMTIGFAGGLLFAHHRFDIGRPFGERGFRRGPPGEPAARALVPHLRRMLDLTPDQSDAIRDEIEKTRADFAQVRDSLHARIERHLTPEQRERWRRIADEEHPGEPRGRSPHDLRAEPGREGDVSR